MNLNPNLKHLLGKISNLLLDIRALERLVTQEDFMDLYESSSPEGRLRIEDLCEAVRHLNQKGRLDALYILREMVKSHAGHETSIRDLKEAAARLGIPRYSRMDKLTLRLAIAARKGSNGRADSREVCENKGVFGISGDVANLMHLQEGQYRGREFGGPA